MGLVRLPSPSTVLIGSVAALAARDATLLKKVFVALLVLNWRNLPLAWHTSFWWTVPELYLKIFRKGHDKAMAIGRSPFEVKTVTKGHVSFADADYNAHMSNSSYAKVSDAARFRFLLELVGPAMGEGIWSPLASTSYTFYREIPLGAKYEIECHIVSWDEKWIYYVSRFTTAPRKGSKERTLNCVAFSRSCFKLRGSRLSIPPSRVLSISGVGSDRSNWARTLKLRKERKVGKWLEYGGALVAQKAGKWTGALPAAGEGWEDDGMSMYEEQRLANLAKLDNIGVVQKAGETADWVDL
ncbi:hypothetical protein NBRC10512_003608 [Rhodotorula toruloides]|uniref:RHTO0S09e02388g1_1 n=2 Tax=Rhodotorula toruloides TaxID=5286 RepID=A0A061B8U8_RHOTO|nr:uncharacterized protein RHTO_07826 [Rhodotorula toruloides NP11]EMS22956.1 hypothetical protein RHTO_07826 [Rhodotorula toruloides NP11]KAJ8292702.1 hypothetical protein OF846_003977 [Rhodotorula toruloides]CDR44313.1 RHTO0S09e02388g1_1 [Rhodotorula toruloides]